MLIDEIEALARNPKLLRQNLQNARPPIKEILHFIFSSHTLDLPTDALDERNFGDIAFAQNPRGDALAIESSALSRVFVPSQNPDLNRQKRIKIPREILRICTVRERQFLLNAIKTRSIPGIPREVVAEVYGEDWLLPRPPQGRTVMPKMPEKKVDKRQEYIPFKDLKSLGYVQ